MPTHSSAIAEYPVWIGLTETNLAYSNILNQMREWKEKYTTLRQITDHKMGCEEDVHFIIKQAIQ